MRGLIEDRLHGPGFDHLALVQHDHFFRHVGDHAQIVRDNHHRHLELFLQLHDELQNLRLNRHIERSGRFVGDQQRRTADQRHRNHRPLPQTARQFERIGLNRSRRIRKSHQPQHFHHGGVPLLLAQIPVQRQSLLDLIADRMQRRERRHRLLKYDRNAPAAQRA